MVSSQDIIFAIAGQSLVLDVIEGRPSGTPTFSVYWAGDGEDATAEFSGSGSIDSVSTTTTAAAGHSNTNRKLITVVSTTGISVGREYLLTAADGQYEWVEVVAVDSSDLQVTTRSPLQGEYPIGATLVSTRITGSVDDTWAADKNHLVNILCSYS